MGSINKYLFGKSGRSWKYWDFVDVEVEYDQSDIVLSTMGTYVVNVCDSEAEDKMQVFADLYKKYLGVDVKFERMDKSIYYTYDFTDSIRTRGLFELHGSSVRICSKKAHKKFVKLCDKMIREYYTYCVNKRYAFANYVIIPNAICGLNMANAWAC